MATLIPIERLEKHAVNKYNFKSLENSELRQDTAFSSLMSTSAQEEETQEAEVYTEDDNPNRRLSDVDSSAMSKGSKDALIESLMKKTDEMSSNFIKLQMKLESKEEEHAAALEEIKNNSFNEGLAAGVQKAIEETNSDVKEGIEQFATSVTTLENAAKEFESALERIKADLMSAAIDIAQEVVDIEVSEKSSEIASVLSDALIKDLQSASKITLKVNPKDHGGVSEHVGSLDHIQIVSDSAVNDGGVIAISDTGNIDSQISKRFERVKRAALSE